MEAANVRVHFAAQNYKEMYSKLRTLIQSCKLNKEEKGIKKDEVISSKVI